MKYSDVSPPMETIQTSWVPNWVQSPESAKQKSGDILPVLSAMSGPEKIVCHIQ